MTDERHFLLLSVKQSFSTGRSPRREPHFPMEIKPRPAFMECKPKFITEKQPSKLHLNIHMHAKRNSEIF